jgi:hypothetical protein
MHVGVNKVSSCLHVNTQYQLYLCMCVYIYICMYRFQNVFLRCPTPRLHCFLSSHWPSFRFLSCMAFLFLPSRQQIGLEETIIKEIEQNQLTWYGRIQRMAEGRLPKIALKWIPKQKRASCIYSELKSRSIFKLRNYLIQFLIRSSFNKHKFKIPVYVGK